MGLLACWGVSVGIKAIYYLGIKLSFSLVIIRKLGGSVRSLRFRVQGFRFRVQSSGFRVSGIETGFAGLLR